LDAGVSQFKHHQFRDFIPERIRHSLLPPFIHTRLFKPLQVRANQAIHQVFGSRVFCASQGGFRNLPAAGNRHDNHFRHLPLPLKVRLSDGNIEAPAQPILQAPDHLPFVFQRLGVLNTDFQNQRRDGYHARIPLGDR
jgi:hypothetical protein